MFKHANEYFQDFSMSDKHVFPPALYMTRAIPFNDSITCMNSCQLNVYAKTGKNETEI